MVSNTDEEDQLNEHVQDPGDPDGVIEAERQRVWQEKHPAPSATPSAEYKPKHRVIKTVLVLLVLAAAVGGAYMLGSHQAGKHQQTSKGEASASASSEAKQNAQSATVPTKNYSSTNFGLSFDYPSDWTLSDTTAKLTLTSPAIPLMTAVGAKVSAHVVVTIQNQQTSVPGFPSGGAVASLASDDLTYKQPSSVQRGQTYLSYLSYTQPNGLDALYLTGNNGYQQGQAIPMSDIAQGNPLVSVGFEKCSANTCSGGTADSVTLLASDWKSAAMSSEVTDLLESIIING